MGSLGVERVHFGIRRGQPNSRGGGRGLKLTGMHRGGPCCGRWISLRSPWVDVVHEVPHEPVVGVLGFREIGEVNGVRMEVCR